MQLLVLAAEEDAGDVFVIELGRAPRFLVDAMLGRLARWLRLLGYDSVYFIHTADAELVRLARADGRIILTRDHGLARRRGVDHEVALTYPQGEPHLLLDPWPSSVASLTGAIDRNRSPRARRTARVAGAMQPLRSKEG